MGLKFFKRGTYNDVGSTLSLIRQEFEALWAKIGDIKPGEEGALAEQQSYIPDIGSPAVDNEYSGMFKCAITANKEETTVVVIYNGSDELDITDISSFQKQFAGSCYVNNKSWSVQNYYKEYTGNVPDTKWLLKFEHDPSQRLNVTIVEYTDAYSKPLPDGTNTTAWYLLAETKNGRLIQHHISGAPQLFWFSNCNEMDTEDA